MSKVTLVIVPPEVAVSSIEFRTLDEDEARAEMARATDVSHIAAVIGGECVTVERETVVSFRTAGAPAKAPGPPRKRYNPTKAEVNARIAADDERFKAAVAIGTPLEHLKNPHRPSSRAGQAWAALVRAHEERLRAAKVDGAAPAVALAK